MNALSNIFVVCFITPMPIYLVLFVIFYFSEKKGQRCRLDGV